MTILHEMTDHIYFCHVTTDEILYNEIESFTAEIKALSHGGRLVTKLVSNEISKGTGGAK